jgi:hypothetical protein
MYNKSVPDVCLCSELVDAVYRAPGEVCKLVKANLEEVSGLSLTLCTEEPVPVGSEVEVSCKPKNLEGIVTEVEQDDILGWFIHIELDSDPQVGTVFFPQHLVRVHAQPAFDWTASKVA